MLKRIVCLAGLVVLTGCAKWQMDAEVDRLCAKDGGVTIFEQVTLPPSMFDQHGNPKIPQKKDARIADEYYWESEQVYLVSGSPSLEREVFRIIRKRDGKSMGQRIIYRRQGTSISVPWHVYGYSCLAQESLFDNIFIKGDK